MSCTCTPYFSYIFTPFTSFIAEIHVNFTVLAISGIFPRVRTPVLLNKLFICMSVSKIVSTFLFCLRLDDYKAESIYISLHTSTITY